MSQMSDYLEQKLLDHTFRGATLELRDEALQMLFGMEDIFDFR
jgi:hypothetical protein